MAKTLTAANSVILLSVRGLYDAPQQLQGYAADDVLDTDAVESGEVVMGVDGKMSAGWVPKEVRQTFSLQADSASADLFESWYQAQQAIRELYYATCLVYLPSIERKYQLNKGVLMSHNPIPSIKKILQPRKFSITWESVTAGSI